MTGSTDLDRLLGAYLDEGPRRAPDRAVDAAISFARAHPRRRDALGFLRPDVMPRRRALLSPQLAWAVLVVALTLGTVAAVAIGSRPNNAPVLPPPAVTESPAPSERPSEAPSASPTPRSFEVIVTDESDIEHPVQIIDLSGRLDAAEAGPTFNEALVGDVSARNAPDRAGDVLLAWVYVSCADPTTVTIDASISAIGVERPRCEGDTLGGNPLQVTLRFANAVDAGEIEVELVETP